MSDEEDGILIGRIVIERRLYPAGHDLVSAVADKGDGNTEEGLEAVTALGMLRLSEALLVQSMQEDE